MQPIRTVPRTNSHPLQTDNPTPTTKGRSMSRIDEEDQEVLILVHRDKAKR